MIHILDDIWNRLLVKHSLVVGFEGLFIESNFRKVKWLLLGTYRPPSQIDSYYFISLDKALDTCSNYDTVLLVEDLNTEVSGNVIN